MLYILLCKMLVSAVQQCESVIIIHISPPSWASLLCHPTPLGHLSVPDWDSCAVQQLPTNYLFYTWQCIYVSATFSICPTLTFCGCVRMPVLYWVCQKHFSRLHMYALICNTCFSPSDLLHSMRGTRSIHHTKTDSDSLLRLSNILLCVWTTSSLPIHLSVDT